MDHLRDLKRDVANGKISRLPDEGPEVLIHIDELRAILAGQGVLAEGWRRRIIKPTATGIVLDGGSNRRYVIYGALDPAVPFQAAQARSCSSTLLDLTNLASANGGPLPRLVLQRCRIEGILDLSATHLSGLRIHDCQLRGLLADSAQIDDELMLDGLYCLPPFQAQDNEPGYCQLRLIASRIDGSVLIRDACFRSPTIDQWQADRRSLGKQISADRLDAPSERGAYANHFAAALDTCEVGGRLWVARDVVMRGGISLQETIIRGSLRFGPAIVAAHVVNEPGNLRNDINDITGNTEQVAVASYIAFDGTDLKVCGSFIWRSPIKSDLSAGARRIFGRVSLARARIESDLIFEDCRFVALEDLDENDPPSCEVSGGIDLRRSSVGGQLSFQGSCVIGRRARPMSARRGMDLIGPALDATKAEIGLGVLLGRGCAFLGPVHFTDAKIGRELAIECTIAFGLPPQEPKPLEFTQKSDLPVAKKLNDARPYNTALKLTDAHLEGFLRINLITVTGRVSLQRLTVVGSAEIQSIKFTGFLPKRGAERFAAAPFQGIDAEGKDCWAAEPVTHDPPTINETSLLDLQDMTLTGGINWKRNAIQIDIAEDSAIPYSHFIIDLRGMSCGTWDDADATCWAGLNRPAPFGFVARLREFLSAGGWKQRRYGTGEHVYVTVPWRLRLDGMKFDRLDSSRQRIGIEQEITVEPARAQRYLHRFLGRWRDAARAPRDNNATFRKALEWTYNHWLPTWMHDSGAPDRRTYFTLEGENEILHFRLQAIESFDRNRWRLRRTPLGRLRHFGVRWILQSQWRRRELKPPFQPQPFDLFAKAYSARGDLETSLGLIRRRMVLHWRKRLRLLFRACLQVTPYTIGAILICLLCAFVRPGLIPVAPTVAGISPTVVSVAFFLGAATLMLLVPVYVLVICGSAVLAFECLFGFGLNGRRALLTAALFPIAVWSASALLLPEGKVGSCESIARSAMVSLDYGVDKLIPGDSGSTKEAVNKLEQRTECGTVRRTMRRFDAFFELLGWITISLVVLTLSGFLRRDIERA